LDRIAESYTAEINKANVADDLKLAATRTEDYLVVCRLIAQKFKIKHYLYQAIREKLVNLLSSNEDRDVINSCVVELAHYVSGHDFEKDPPSIQCYTLILIAKGLLVNYQIDKTIAYLEKAASFLPQLEQTEQSKIIATDIFTHLKDATLLKENSHKKYQGSLRDSMFHAFIKVCNSQLSPSSVQEESSQSPLVFNGVRPIRMADYFGTPDAYLVVLNSFNQ
jgi:hypothetical protein